jgi:hypothetical protein
MYILVRIEGLNNFMFVVHVDACIWVGGYSIFPLGVSFTINYTVITVKSNVFL